ncbi:hypothetical protein D5R81_15980 [Parashewanella spongiae]|uniref:Uncharacterized protein n=1 Tax=Parashewanella spongiae TaxID=342950 RepID=A0A3A6TF54_9GAMM|nr:hypothetical protein [Parashewanella spongiae]MCL1079539.1 hypothetical protein [Parashewanella spongiae]RJY07388.1 hypothetical protein D5R81_15980 [Parashewanella spongiae]
MEDSFQVTPPPPPYNFNIPTAPVLNDREQNHTSHCSFSNSKEAQVHYDCNQVPPPDPVAVFPYNPAVAGGYPNHNNIVGDGVQTLYSQHQVEQPLRALHPLSSSSRQGYPPATPFQASLQHVGQSQLQQQDQFIKSEATVTSEFQEVSHFEFDLNKAKKEDVKKSAFMHRIESGVAQLSKGEVKSAIGKMFGGSVTETQKTKIQSKAGIKDIGKVEPTDRVNLFSECFDLWLQSPEAELKHLSAALAMIDKKGQKGELANLVGLLKHPHTEDLNRKNVQVASLQSELSQLKGHNSQLSHQVGQLQQQLKHSKAEFASYKDKLSDSQLAYECLSKHSIDKDEQLVKLLGLLSTKESENLELKAEKLTLQQAPTVSVVPSSVSQQPAAAPTNISVHVSPSFNQSTMQVAPQATLTKNQPTLSLPEWNDLQILKSRYKNIWASRDENFKYLLSFINKYTAVIEIFCTHVGAKPHMVAGKIRSQSGNVGYAMLSIVDFLAGTPKPFSVYVEAAASAEGKDPSVNEDVYPYYVQLDRLFK